MYDMVNETLLTIESNWNEVVNCVIESGNSSCSYSCVIVLTLIQQCNHINTYLGISGGFFVYICLVAIKLEIRLAATCVSKL